MKKCTNRLRRGAQTGVALAAGLSMLALGAGCKKQGASSDAASASGGEGAVPPPTGGNLLKAATFEDGKSLPWMAVFSAPGAGTSGIKDGAFCVDVENAGTNRWDAQVRHREMVIQKGHKYTFQFRAWASKETKIYPKVGMAGPPYAEYFGKILPLTTTPQVFMGEFNVDKDDDPTAELAIHLGGGLARSGVPLTVCIDDVYLVDPAFTPPPREEAKPIPKVRVNELGYLAKHVKKASVVSDATAPLTWELLDASGKAVANGQTTVHGADKYSGDSLHWVDFSSADKPGKGYVLKVGEERSDAFDVGNEVYTQLKYDALNYFYQTRSGIELKMPFARQEKWARPAGHLPDKATCAPEATLVRLGWPKDSGCSETVDVTGGWYDAGDHGKYVVNGGIAVWTLLNEFERAKAFNGAVAALADGKLNIPESGNKVPDILDEARWQLEFMLKMQIQAGEKAGLVHHKMHDDSWTALGMLPSEDTKTRLLRPPSTAATLNVAATAAQCSRVFRAYDKKFADQCLNAAKKAYDAAVKFPTLYAPGADTSDGGGPYDDKDVTDEFYWAAAELYATTAETKYLDALNKSPLNTKLMGAAGTESVMTWAQTDALGAITLAVTDNKLGKKERDAQRARLVDVADKYLAASTKEGYGLPFAPKGDGYPWGSNSFVLNNMVVLGLAYDFTKDVKYLNGVIAGMDSVLGRNAMGRSYVTGYGERPLEHPHHRFWASQANERFPSAPPGIVSGGPNSGLEDPYAQAAGLKGCKPQKCFIDHIEAWSTNEITINWNAPLAWAAAFLDEKATEKAEKTSEKPASKAK